VYFGTQDVAKASSIHTTTADTQRWAARRGVL